MVQFCRSFCTILIGVAFCRDIPSPINLTRLSPAFPNSGYNQNTGQVHTRQPYHPNEVVPGTSVEGRRGNSATKALEPGCAYVNGRRVCN
jgi:hypothetical protein